MILLQDLFQPNLFEKYIDKDVEDEYVRFQKESHELKNAENWDGLENLGERFYQSSKCKLFVFLSHSHNDLQYTKGLISFLRKQYNVYVYIDSEDRSLPLRTSIETAQVIKKKIKKCDRFIFLASNGAIDSKWCNWELGMGDVQKIPDNLAFLAWHDTQIARQNYKGNEYMEIYPFIVYCEGDGNGNTNEQGVFNPENFFHEEIESNSGFKNLNVPKQCGWYVRFKKNKTFTYIPLSKWLS